MIRDDFSDGSECSAPDVSVPDARFQDLRRRVSDIKESQSSRALDNDADREEWARERLQLKAIQNEQQCHIAELKSHLASVIDRTTRIRNAYEKEKKQLQSQVSKLQNSSVRIKEQHALSEENIRSMNAREISAKNGDIQLLQERCADLTKQLESQRTEAANKQVKLYEQYRGWLHEAKREHGDALEHERTVQESLKADLERSQAHVCSLQSQLELKEALNAKLTRQISEHVAGMEGKEAQENSLQDKIRCLEKELAAVQDSSERSLRGLALSAEERLEHCKRSHIDEMDNIHERLKGVLQRKNDTIQRLQSSLDAAEARIIAYEEEARREKIRVLESIRW